MLSPSEKLKLKKTIAAQLKNKEWAEIDLTLEEFGGNTQNTWSGDRYSYVLSMLKGVADELLVQLSQHFGFSEPNNDIAGYAASNDQECLYIFISHLAKHKVFASELQSEMAKLGANCFVAHEDIEPDAEWQVEIERALRECDALIALLHDGFSESTWTDQEVGFALGRGAPVFSVRLDVAPYGLFGKKQAFNGKGKSVSEIAGELWEAYKKHPKTTEKASDTVVAKFCKSGSFAEAKANCEQVETLVTWTPSYTSQLREAVGANEQIKYSWGVPDRIDRLIRQRDPSSVGTASPVNEDVDSEIPF